MTVKLGMTHAQLINAINSDIDLIKDQGSKIITKEFPASGTETSSVQLDTKCQGKDYMFVFMDYGILEPSKYSLSADGLTVNFSPAIPANHKIIIRYFTPGSSFTNYVTDEFQSNLLNYTTNRILEIPQDIKLELNNGTLTLKAGSKLYKPNGFEADGTTPKFDEIVISVDNTGLEWFSTDTNDYIIFYEIGVGIDGTLPERCTSGTSYPSSPANGDRCYRTDLNRLYTYRTSSSSWIEKESLPLGIVRSSGTAGKVGSIDQVFNGFGYIGSHFFVLPGVKVQIPDERNEDGSYKTFSVKTDSVKTASFPNTVLGGMNWYIDNFGNAAYYGSNYIKFSENNLWESTDGKGYILKGVVVATSDVTSGVISNWKPCNVDSVANSNASNFSQAGRSYLSGLGMPSNRYIDLTLGASGSTYTAPANGWFFADGNWSPDGSRFNVTMDVGEYGVQAVTGASGSTFFRVLCPVVKGAIMTMSYTLATIVNFRFIYAEGENNV